MGVEAAVAVGAEQVGQADVALPQYEVEVCVGAIRARFTDCAESGQRYRCLVVIGVDDCSRIEFSQEKAVIRAPLTAILRRMGCPGVAGRRFKSLQAHSIDSLCFQWWL